MSDCTDEQILLKVKELQKETEKARDVEFETIGISASQPWSFNMANRKHCFLWTGAALTLNVEDYTTNYVLTQNTWVNIRFPQGAKVFGNNTNLLYVQILHTDEVLP